MWICIYTHLGINACVYVHTCICVYTHKHLSISFSQFFFIFVNVETLYPWFSDLFLVPLLSRCFFKLADYCHLLFSQEARPASYLCSYYLCSCSSMKNAIHCHVNLSDFKYTMYLERACFYVSSLRASFIDMLIWITIARFSELCDSPGIY